MSSCNLLSSKYICVFVFYYYCIGSEVWQKCISLTCTFTFTSILVWGLQRPLTPRTRSLEPSNYIDTCVISFILGYILRFHGALSAVIYSAKTIWQFQVEAFCIIITFPAHQHFTINGQCLFGRWPKNEHTNQCAQQSEHNTHYILPACWWIAKLLGYAYWLSSGA